MIFSVGVIGNPPFSYQWQKDGSPIPHETNSTLVLNNLNTSDAGDYSVVVTSGFGSATSSPANLMVNPYGRDF
jgi:hypothetical protein